MWFFSKKQKVDSDSPKELTADWKRGLEKTNRKFIGLFTRLFSSSKEEWSESLEKALLAADLGPKITQEVMKLVDRKLDPDKILATVKEYLRTLLISCEGKFSFSRERDEPLVILMVGVNGVGKTTTVAKLAYRIQQQGQKVLLAAGDTFRAAAIEQLQYWGKNLNIPVVAQTTGADSAAVIYDAYQAANARKYTVLLADTAGRLHNKQGLLDELKKIERVLQKQALYLPQEVWLVLDATTGQNALKQVEEFRANFKVTGLVITKLDGTSKGGALFAISKATSLPIYFVGMGENKEALVEFNAQKFVEAIFE